MQALILPLLASVALASYAPPNSNNPTSYSYHKDYSFFSQAPSGPPPPPVAPPPAYAVVQPAPLPHPQNVPPPPPYVGVAQVARPPVIYKQECALLPALPQYVQANPAPAELYQQAMSVGAGVAGRVYGGHPTPPAQQQTPAGSGGADRYSRMQSPRSGVAGVDQYARVTMEAAKYLHANGYSYLATPGNPVGHGSCYAPVACNPDYRYRYMNGSCNNLQQPLLGQTHTPLRRILPNAYADGFDQPTGNQPGGSSYLPSARVVSTQVLGTVESYNVEWTALFMTFAQFIDHDITHVPFYVNTDVPNGPSIDCCSSQGDSNVCFPIPLPAYDVLGKSCMNFVRSQRAPRLDCQPGPSEQINQVTHWIDSSMLYGSSDNDAAELRTFNGGLLKYVQTNYGKELMPLVEDGKNFMAGDERVNQHPYLALLNTVFFREHNRWARELQRMNPHWSDEILYQESRRIINAEWQHIIYSEYLPGLLGPSYANRCGLTPRNVSYSADYYTDFDPTVANEFSAAAFRVGHTMIPSVVNFISAYGKLQAQTLLRDLFENIEAVQSPGGVDSLLLGVTQSPMANVDENFSEEILNHLFGSLDLIALDVQRGRDHGLPGYIEYRKICGIGGPVLSFDDLRDVISPDKISRLTRVYQRVEHIDLFVGMSLETPLSRDSLVGPTFGCIIGDQFTRLKFGDRFFYDLGGQAWSFTPDQLNEIRKSTMSRLICDNGDNIQQMQPFAFLLPNPQSNPISPCNGYGSIPIVNINAWAEVPPPPPPPPNSLYG